jgi:hypothetical protein
MEPEVEKFIFSVTVAAVWTVYYHAQKVISQWMLSIPVLTGGIVTLK